MLCVAGFLVKLIRKIYFFLLLRVTKNKQSSIVVFTTTDITKLYFKEKVNKLFTKMYSRGKSEKW
jgi:hypothetical protein